MASKANREILSASFLDAAARNPKALPETNAAPQTPVEIMLRLTETARQEVLLPGQEKIKAGLLKVENKDTGDLRGGDAKTITVETDRIIERRLTELQAEAFPGAFIIGEEMFGAADVEAKKEMLQKALNHDGLVIMNDALDGTKPYTQGKDGFGSMVSMVKDGKLVGAVVHLTRQKDDPEGLGYTLTWEEGDVVRMDGAPLPRLDAREFPTDAKMLRGYAGFEYLKGTDELSAAFAVHRPPGDLRAAFDSMSDHWTCGTLYRDLLQGRHHFMLVPPPVDLFDYPMGIALIEKAGGVVKFADGTPATLEEIVKRQGFGKPSFNAKKADETVQHLTDPENFRAPENTLIFAVNEQVFQAVQKAFQEKLLDRRRNPAATDVALKGGNPAHAQGFSGAVGASPGNDPEVAKAISVLDLFDSTSFRYISAPLLYSRGFFGANDSQHEPDGKDYYQELIKANLDHANDIADRAKASGSAVIVPARFNDTPFPFTPKQRMQFLFEVINKKATSMQMVDGWEFSPPAIEEFMSALLLQSGRGDRTNIDIVDEKGARLAVPQALEAVAGSVEEGLRGKPSRLILSHAQDFMHLVALSAQLRRDVMMEHGVGFGVQGMTAKEAAETDQLLRDLRPLRDFLLDKFTGLYLPVAQHYDDDVAQRVKQGISTTGGIIRREERQLLSDQPYRVDVPDGIVRAPKKTPKP